MRALRHLDHLIIGIQIDVEYPRDLRDQFVVLVATRTQYVHRRQYVDVLGQARLLAVVQLQPVH